MGSAARQVARRRAREQRRARRQLPALYHGTAWALADQVRLDGLARGGDGRVWLTDNPETALVYATWGAVAQAVVGETPHPLSDLGCAARAAEGKAGAPVAVIVKARVTQELVPVDEFAPPLPWQRTVAPGASFYVREPIPASHCTEFRVYDLPDLADPAKLATAATDVDLVAAAFPRNGGSGALCAAIPDPSGLWNHVIETSPGAKSEWHGLQHWLHVAAAGLELLAAGCGAHAPTVFAFALLHDSQRQTEGRDPEHGARAAQIARDLAGDQLRLGADELDRLCDALTLHDRGEVTDDPTIGACWDADRLTLTRLGITPDPALLSTAVAASLIDQVRDCGGTPVDSDWMLYRFHLEAER